MPTGVRKVFNVQEYERFLAAVKTAGGKAAAVYGRELNIPASTARDYAHRAEGEKRVRREGKTKNTVWFAVEVHRQHRTRPSELTSAIAAAKRARTSTPNAAQPPQEIDQPSGVVLNPQDALAEAADAGLEALYKAVDANPGQRAGDYGKILGVPGGLALHLLHSNSPNTFVAHVGPKYTTWTVRSEATVP